jgi:hypothetical protein
MADNEKLTPERSVRLLRAKAGELEHWVLAETALDGEMRPMVMMAADIALVAALLADHIEESERRDEWTLNSIKDLNEMMRETVATLRSINDKVEARHE